MENEKDKESSAYYWRKYCGSQKSVDDFLWRSTDHGPTWSDKEIKEAVQGVCKNLTQIIRRQESRGRLSPYLQDFNPKHTKKKLIEYIKKHI